MTPSWLQLAFARLVTLEAGLVDDDDERQRLLTLAARATKDARATEADFLAAKRWLRKGRP